MKKGLDFTGVAIVFQCHDGKGNFLLGKRTDQCRDEHGRWDPGGGGLRFGEKAEEAVAREVAEEYGTDIIKLEQLGYRDCHRTHEGQPTHWIALDFLVHIDKNKVKNMEPHKLEKFAWFKFNEWPEPIHSQWPAFLEMYGDIFEKVARESTK